MRMSRNIYRRKDGRFEGRYKNGYKADGKTKYRSVFGKTYAEVKEKMERAKADVPLLKPVSAAKPPTVAEAVSAYLETERVRLKPSTIGVYRRQLDCHITPLFGKMRCDELTAEISQNFVNILIEKNGLAVVTAQSIFNLLKSALPDVKAEVFAVKFPKQAKKSVDFLTSAEQKRIEQAAKERENGDDYIAIMLCLYTGIRIGELCALRWSDVIFERKSLQINQTIQRIRSDGETKTEITFLTPKSATSAREIPLPEFLFKMLRDWKRSAKNDYVVSYKDKPIEPRTLQYRFKRILEAAEVKDVNFHVTRHTFATRALQNGFDVKSLSEILGHSTATVTLNKYTHSDTEHKRDCMNSLSAFYSEG